MLRIVTFTLAKSKIVNFQRIITENLCIKRPHYQSYPLRHINHTWSFMIFNYGFDFAWPTSGNLPCSLVVVSKCPFCEYGSFSFILKANHLVRVEGTGRAMNL